MSDKTDKLKMLLDASSKHSSYQLLSKKLTEIIGAENIHVKSRFEEERFEFINSQTPISGSKIIDIGGNTGYFTFESLERGASSVVYYEGNASHAEFVSEAAQLLEVEKKVDIHNDYYQFNDSEKNDTVDIIILLNVLHHVGDDYGDKTLGIEKAKETILHSLNLLAQKTKYLVFQLGFCWQGDRNKLLFENGTKQEMIDFILNGTKNHWEIIAIGIAEQHDNKIVYCSSSPKNLERNDKMGEFLNRPLFIFKSKK